jgi:hypothetical protein
LCICCSFARTEVSSTSSPTTTRTPPISDGSTVDRGVQLAAKFLFQRGDQLATWVADISNALAIGRVGGAGLGVLQHCELRADFRQQGDAAIFGQHREEVRSLRRSAAT